MSTIYYGRGPLFFKSESALMAYLNQKTSNDYKLPDSPHTESHLKSSTYSITRILIIGGCIILMIYLLGKASENTKPEGEDISNAEI